MNETVPRPPFVPTLLVAFTAAAMVALGTLFYTRATAGQASADLRLFLLTATGACTAPFVWVLLNAAMKRSGTAMLAALVSAVAFLVVFGWFAVVLALLSWGDTTLMLPAAGIPVQVTALVAAVIGWLRTPAAVRNRVSRFQGIAVPLLLAGALAATSVAVQRAIEHGPERREAAHAAARAAVAKAGECLRSYFTAHGAYPDSLVQVASLEACSELASRSALSGYSLDYFPAPAATEGRHVGFGLCARPTRPPDSGLVTFVADDSLEAREAIASSEAGGAVACGQAWAESPRGFARQIRQCTLEFATSSRGRGYPGTLADLFRALPECMGAPDARTDGEHAAIRQLPGAHDVYVRYVAGRPGPQGRVLDYRLFVACVPGDGFAIFDDRQAVLNASTRVAQKLLANCKRDDEGEADREFGAVPDLAARRADCNRDASTCHWLGMELERAVHLAGANPNAVDDLTAEQRALIVEANGAFDRACSQGEPRACTAHAEALLDGRAIASDPAAAVGRLTRACEGGYAPACVRLGEIYERGRRAMRATTALFKATPYSEAQSIRVQAPDPTGPGIECDSASAVVWYSKACDFGDVGGCLLAARVSLESAEAEAERQAALVRFAELCDLGHGNACAVLANDARDQGTTVQGRDAAEWQRIACALGDAASC